MKKLTAYSLDGYELINLWLARWMDKSVDGRMYVWVNQLIEGWIDR